MEAVCVIVVGGCIAAVVPPAERSLSRWLRGAWLSGACLVTLHSARPYAFRSGLLEPFSTGVTFIFLFAHCGPLLDWFARLLVIVVRDLVGHSVVCRLCSW